MFAQIRAGRVFVAVVVSGRRRHVFITAGNIKILVDFHFAENLNAGKFQNVAVPVGHVFAVGVINNPQVNVIIPCVVVILVSFAGDAVKVPAEFAGKVVALLVLVV